MPLKAQSYVALTQQSYVTSADADALIGILASVQQRSGQSVASAQEHRWRTADKGVVMGGGRVGRRHFWLGVGWLMGMPAQ